MTHTDIAVSFLRLVVTGKINEAYDRHVAADFRHHNPHFRGDRESLRQGMEENHGRFPNKQLEVKQTLAEGDRVAVFSQVRLDANGPVMALAHVFRFDGDKIVEIWDLGQPVPDNSPNENGMF